MANHNLNEVIRLVSTTRLKYTGTVNQSAQSSGWTLQPNTVAKMSHVGPDGKRTKTYDTIRFDEVRFGTCTVAGCNNCIH